jgi:hypothetical protein
MAYISAYGACFVCGVPFVFNPLHVPSFPVQGVREPICETCITATNAERRRRGLAPFPIHPDAYVGEDEANVPLSDD